MECKSKGKSKSKSKSTGLGGWSATPDDGGQWIEPPRSHAEFDVAAS